MKRCTKCKMIKHLTEFYKNCRTKSGLSFICKECDRVKGQTWARKYPQKARNLARRKRWKKQGLDFSDSQYQELLVKQNYCCAICGKHQNQTRRLDLDHNHMTQKIRGLLCASCNLTVVHAVEYYNHLIEKAREYLNDYERSRFNLS